MILVPEFRVQFKPDVTEVEINEYNKKHGVEIVAEHDLGHNSYLLAPEEDNDKDALELANIYHRSRLTHYSEPAWAFTIPSAAIPDDTFYSEQWGLSKMGLPSAWRINSGDPSIKIAIVDEGVQTNHPDLSGKIVTPYDAVGNDNNQNPNAWDSHGTACAGIAAASTNNNRGIAGVAPDCKIIPIRIAYTTGPRSNWITNTTWIARGIRVAAIRKADVISNSWGGGPYSNAIRAALQFAQTSGRGGKGCVIISATGNGDRNFVSYPAKYPESLACGASNEWDQRKSRTSSDGEHWWGSQYGPEVDFLAPGVHIHTTYNTNSGRGSYVDNFNGTSSATPHASGLAALLLSVDSRLRSWEVADILRLTAVDLGPNGRDDEHGWGRLNAERALQAAKKVWYGIELKPVFLGRGSDCYMRFENFRLYNSGINRIRINSFRLRSFGADGEVIDEFTYETNNGGVMLPGLFPNGGANHEINFSDILLKANGTRANYSYRWMANWRYTYWRPNGSVINGQAAQDFAPDGYEDTGSISAVGTNSAPLSENGSTQSVDSMSSMLTAVGDQPNTTYLPMVNGNGLPVELTVKFN